MHKFILFLTLSSALACGPQDKESNNQDGATSPQEQHNHQHDHQGTDPANDHDHGTDSILAQNGTYRASIHWMGDLISRDDGNHTAHVTFTKPDGQPLTHEDQVDLAEFKPWMPAHGHGAYMGNIQMEKTRHDQFTVTGVLFTMAGAASMWEIHLSATVNGIKDQARIPVPEVQ